MKCVTATLSMVLFSPLILALGATPVAKVLELLSDLSAKVAASGVEAKSSYDEFSAWCEDGSKNLKFDISTSKGEVEDLNAAIEMQTATTTSLTTKIDELSASIATSDGELKKATEVRSKESADFEAEEKELVEVMDTLERATGIVAKEMKSGASALQLKSADNLAQALSAMVGASVLSSADAGTLAALVQSSQESEAEDDALGAPAAVAYESKSGSIVEILEGLSEKAETQLTESRKKEMSALHSFEMVKQSLEDQIKYDTKNLEQAKQGLAASAENKAIAEGDLAVTSKALEADTTALADLDQDCMAKAQDFEVATKDREDELAALSEAQKVIGEATGGAESATYSMTQVSFLQLKSTTSTPFAVVRFVRELGRKHSSSALAQLASRMAEAATSSNAGAEGPFAKVKGLISGMIEKLMDEASADATQKAFCDKEMAEATSHKVEYGTDIEKLTSKIDQMGARSAYLKEEVAALQKTLSDMVASTGQMDKMRVSETAAFAKDKAEMEQGIEGVKLALKILRDYYASKDSEGAAKGAATSIVGLLEVVESDFSKGLAEMTAAEESAAANYKKESKENAIDKAIKDQDVKYKTKESVDLDKTAAEETSDRAGVKDSLVAVVEYLAKLEEKCVAKPESYEARAAHRVAEIAGLEEAVQMLSGDTVFLQHGVTRSRKSRIALRGPQLHVSL